MSDFLGIVEDEARKREVIMAARYRMPGAIESAVDKLEGALIEVGKSFPQTPQIEFQFHDVSGSTDFLILETKMSRTTLSFDDPRNTICCHIKHLGKAPVLDMYLLLSAKKNSVNEWKLTWANSKERSDIETTADDFAERVVELSTVSPIDLKDFGYS